MNFLEGLKRLLSVIALAAMTIAGFAGWSDGSPPRWCSDPIVWDQGVMRAPGEPVPSQPDLCPVGKRAAGRQVMFAAGYVAATAGVFLVIWLALRWIIIGFFPAAVRKP